MIWVIYNLLFPIGFALFLPYFLLRMRRRGGYARNFGQRLGIYSPEVRAKLAEGGRIWLHAVSVGEVFVALQFMEGLRAKHSNVRFILSTTTSTGYALAEKKLNAADVLLYFPVDFIPVMRRVLNLAKPKAILLVECEFWPNLIRMARSRNIPVVLINGRISARSFKGYHRLRLFMNPILDYMTLLCAQSSADAQRLLDLGAGPEKVKIMGSAKYDILPPDPSGETKARELLTAAGIQADDLVLLGGSTWPGEEAILLDMFRDLRQRFPNLVLVLVPRHVERSASIMEEIAQRKLQVLRRSQIASGQKNDKRPEVLLVDTTGELKNLYTCATVIFVGKSLTQHGGQNLIEPAICGKAVVVGPHMENFPGIIDDFRDASAVVQIQDAQGLNEAVSKLLGDRAARETLGRKAIELIRTKAGAVKATIELLDPMLS
jgi:3-deoxy-D-manno-octulosonic-acid transferase